MKERGEEAEQVWYDLQVSSQTGGGQPHFEPLEGDGAETDRQENAGIIQRRSCKRVTRSQKLVWRETGLYSPLE